MERVFCSRYENAFYPGRSRATLNSNSKKLTPIAIGGHGQRCIAHMAICPWAGIAPSPVAEPYDAEVFHNSLTFTRSDLLNRSRYYRKKWKITQQCNIQSYDATFESAVSSNACRCRRPCSLTNAFENERLDCSTVVTEAGGGVCDSSTESTPCS